MTDPSKKLPFLPGYRFEQPKGSHAKGQKFAVVQGVMCTDVDKRVKAAKGITNQQESSIGTHRLGITKTPLEVDVEDLNQPPQRRKVAPTEAPDWVKYDRHVLRFNAYFVEHVAEGLSTSETSRVRKVIIHYFLNDKSMSIVEPRVENAGIPQGTLVKRHRIPKDEEQYFGIDDLAVGAELTIYAVKYKLVDCDPFTRNFFAEQGKRQKDPLPFPGDAFSIMAQANRAHFRKTMNKVQEFEEARLGRVPQDVEAATKFFKHDGETLRFYCSWDDQSMYGEKRNYLMRYFLADDTVEVLEILETNAGRDPFPALLKRSRLPRDFQKTAATMATIGVTHKDKSQYYTEADFRVGQTVNVFGRELLIVSCDAATKKFYKEKFGLSEEDFPEVEVKEEAPEAIKRPIPPHTGFGTDEDSLGSFYSLVPKPPKKDIQKIVENEGNNLRFLAKFTAPTKMDAPRRFVITFFTSDDTISIFEKFVRNSGFVGGKFLERTKLRNQATGEFFNQMEFFVGAQLEINKFKFTLLQGDEFTYKFMEARPQLFPRADMAEVRSILVKAGLNAQTLNRVADAFVAMDKNKNGKLELEEFEAAMHKEGYNLDRHQVITIFRKYDKNRDGVIDFKEFLQEFARV